MLLRFIEDKFDPDQSTTIGVDFKTTKLTIDGNTVKLAIWVSYQLPITKLHLQNASIKQKLQNRYSLFITPLTYLGQLELYGKKKET